MRRVWVFILVLAAGAVAGASFYVARKVDRKSAGGEARVIHPERRMISSMVNATGTVRLRVGSEVRVGSQLSGIVKKLNVTVGTRVTAGDVIAEIDDRPIQARLADAEAQAQVDGASLDRARANYHRAEELVAQALI